MIQERLTREIIRMMTSEESDSQSTIISETHNEDVSGECATSALLTIYNHIPLTYM